MEVFITHLLHNNTKLPRFTVGLGKYRTHIVCEPSLTLQPQTLAKTQEVLHSYLGPTHLELSKEMWKTVIVEGHGKVSCGYFWSLRSLGYREEGSPYSF